MPLLIADGHHRYETAVAFREEDPSATHTFAVLVSTRSPGVEIFPTHRVAQSINSEPEGLETSSWDQSSLTLYRGGEFFRVDTHHDALDVQAVERFEPQGVTYTPYAEEAIAAVDAGEADAAFLVRAPTIAQVAEFAERGETMPQKSTYFFPKLTSGLLALSRAVSAPWTGRARLAGAVPRGGRGREGRARGDARPRGARAAGRRGQGRRRDRRARRGGRDRGAASTSSATTSASSPRRSAIRGEGRYTVVVDPIDGSQNAERGIPYFCLCVAVADGDTVDDVFFGYVYDFGANEEWTATRGEGALLNGGPILDGAEATTSSSCRSRRRARSSSTRASRSSRR